MTTFTHQYAQTSADVSVSAGVDRHVPVRFRRVPVPYAKAVAFIVSVLLHAGVAWWAMHVPFHSDPLTTEARVAWKQGKTADAVNLRMVTVQIDTSKVTFAPPTPVTPPDAPTESAPAGASAGVQEGAAPDAATNQQNGSTNVADAVMDAAPSALPPVLASGAVVPVREPALVERIESTTAAAASPTPAPVQTPAGEAVTTQQSIIASVAPSVPHATGADAAVRTEVAPVTPPLPVIEVIVADVKPSPPTPTEVAVAPAATQSAAPSSQAEQGVREGIDIADLPKPSYPMLSRRMKEEGKVVLDVQVLADGTVGRVTVVSAPPHRRLVDAAIDAVRKATFRPATLDGRAVEDVVRIPFIFRLE